jgi:transformer-2 protein
VRGYQDTKRDYHRDVRSPRETHNPDEKGSRNIIQFQRAAFRGDSQSQPYRPAQKHKRQWPTDLPPSAILGVFNMNTQTTRDDVQSLFGSFGEIDKIVMIARKNYCFVYFHDVQSATEAKNQMNGFELHGRSIRVDYSATSKGHNSETRSKDHHSQSND